MRVNMRKMNDNQAGTIAAIKVAGDLGRRIRDMGLVPGTDVLLQDSETMDRCGSLATKCHGKGNQARRPGSLLIFFLFFPKHREKGPLDC